MYYLLNILFIVIFIFSNQGYSAFESLNKKISFLNNIDSKVVADNPAYISKIKNYDFQVLYNTPFYTGDNNFQIPSFFLSSGFPIYKYAIFSAAFYYLDVDFYREKFYKIGYALPLQFKKFIIKSIASGISATLYNIDTIKNQISFFDISVGGIISFNESIEISVYTENILDNGKIYVNRNFYGAINFILHHINIKSEIKKNNGLDFSLNLEFILDKNYPVLKVGRSYNHILYAGLLITQNVLSSSKVVISFLYEFKEILSDVNINIGFKF